MTELLTTKELASALGRSRSYICAMKARGFPMPGGTATIEEARAWLSANPPPRGSDPTFSRSHAAIGSHVSQPKS